MDVDSELDGSLLQQFSAMGTTDKEVLVAEFQKLLGNQLNQAGCEFFLEMNKWNLQEAICAYYDYEQPAPTKLPSMSFVRDITIGEGESVPPDTDFVKSWQVQNSGDEVWPPCSLWFVGGEQFGEIDSVEVEQLQPGAVTNISVQMHSPTEQGMYQGQWRMKSDKGYFGETIWVILQVATGGILSVTQQLSRFGRDLIDTDSKRHSNVTENPFATPTKLSSSLPNSALFPTHVSPSPSIIAQHGSTPNSPRMIDTPFQSPQPSQVATTGGALPGYTRTVPFSTATEDFSVNRSLFQPPATVHFSGGVLHSTQLSSSSAAGHPDDLDLNSLPSTDMDSEMS